MLAAVAALPGSTDAINSAQWSSGLLLGTCCSCHRARLIIPSVSPLPSFSPSPLPPAATMTLLPPTPPFHPSFPSFPEVCNDAQSKKTKRLKWVNEFSLLLRLTGHSYSQQRDMIAKFKYSALFLYIRTL